MASQNLYGSFNRLSNFPIETNTLFQTKEALDQFLATSKTSYPGQLLVVTNDEGQNGLYLVKVENDSFSTSKIIKESDLIEELRSLEDEIGAYITSLQDRSSSLEDEDARLDEKIDGIESRLDSKIDGIESSLTDTISQKESSLLDGVSAVNNKADINASAISSLNGTIQSLADELRLSDSELGKKLNRLLYDTETPDQNAVPLDERLDSIKEIQDKINAVLYDGSYVELNEKLDSLKEIQEWLGSIEKTIRIDFGSGIESNAITVPTGWLIDQVKVIVTMPSGEDLLANDPTNSTMYLYLGEVPILNLNVIDFSYAPATYVFDTYQEIRSTTKISLRHGNIELARGFLLIKLLDKLAVETANETTIVTEVEE